MVPLFPNAEGEAVFWEAYTHTCLQSPIHGWRSELLQEQPEGG